MSLFVNNTVRSAGETLADLAACRQFRHLNDAGRSSVIDETAAKVKAAMCRFTKHPDADNPCLGCGEPRSKFSLGIPGLCWNCYIYRTTDFWIEDVFATAIKMYGFSCDHCGDVEAVEADQQQAAAYRIASNLEGKVAPILCSKCGQQLKAYCSKHFGRGWRAAPSRNVEKMAIAWFAQKVKVLAEEVKRAA